MRPDQLERRLRERLDALGPAPRAELLHVLMLPEFRAGRPVGEFWGTTRQVQRHHGPSTMAAMGMFDSYEPSGQFTCAACGRLITHWQGKNGPNALFVWRQGVAEPVDQPIAPESRMSPEQRSKFRLPPTFELSGWCEQLHRTDAIGRCHGDVWSDTQIILSGIE